MNAPSACPSNHRVGTTHSGLTFPKDCRLLRTSEFRQVYEKGLRISGPLFAAFCFKREDAGRPRIGFTVPRALGKAVRRNRLKRRMRECARLQLHRAPSGWSVVFNPRRTAIEAPFERLSSEVEKVFVRCAG
ncbi:MAG: ribonuclease P protein component [Acidobacteria bacterium]|nr:ribonuclease P protein component [Acidobacteriota bacterium]